MNDSKKRPNILIAIADDWSFGHAGVYGCDWVKTPHFDRVAREGVLFNRAYTPNAKCAPSRACILTGRNSWQLKAACNHQAFFPPEIKSYPEVLEEKGYHVGYTAKGWVPGIALKEDGTPRPITGKAYSEIKLDPPASGISDIDYTANFSAFLEANDEEKPWCFWYGCLEPHREYEYFSGAQKGGKRIEDIDRVPAYWPDNEIVRNDLLDYAFEVEHFDRHLGLMLEELEKRGELDNTLVLVTSDNGMPFPRVKGQGYDNSNHLPLAIRWPKGIASPGRVIDDFVSFIDFAPTFLETASIDWETTNMHPITGKSLMDILQSNESGQVVDERDHVLIGKEKHDVGRPGNVGYPIRGIVTDELLYLKNYQTDRWPSGNPEAGYPNCDGSPTKTEVLKTRHDPKTRHYWELSFGKRPAEELYKISEDPECMRNLAEDSSYEEVKTRLRHQMESELREQGDPRVSGNGDIFDEYPIFQDDLTNFYEKFTNGKAEVPGWLNASDVEEKIED